LRLVAKEAGVLFVPASMGDDFVPTHCCGCVAATRQS
jgi:hypothetical protein